MTCGIQKVSEGCRTLEAKVTGSINVDINISISSTPSRAGALARMSGGRLPKRIMSGNLDGAVRRGRGEEEKKWTDCLQSDVRGFGIAGD